MSVNFITVVSNVRKLISRCLNICIQMSFIVTQDIRHVAFLSNEAKKRQKAVSQLAGLRSVRGPDFGTAPGP